MTKKQKILACYGHINSPSISRMTGASLSYVANVLSEHDLVRTNFNTVHPDKS